MRQRVGDTWGTLGIVANRRNTYEVHLYLPEAMREPLRRLAAEEDRSVTKLIELVLRRALEEREQRSPA